MSLRERINSDPKLQIGIGAVLLIVVAFVFLGKGGGAEAAPEEPTAAVSEPGVPVEAGSVLAGVPEAGASPVALAAALPAPPMPPKVEAAYKRNEIVAVLFVRDGGIDDRAVSLYSRALGNYLPGSRLHLKFRLFVVSVKEIAKYGALTLGLRVQRVPALIVLRRKSLSKSGPEASVLYGYQSPASIYGALHDAIYNGPSGSYHPG